MMHAFRSTVFLGLAGFALMDPGRVVSSDPDSRGPLEKLALFLPDAVKEWPGVESSTQVSTVHVKGAPKSLHWHVKVDYHAGEKNYPIGWPRFGRTFRIGSQRDWSGWDYLHGWLYTETSRSALPRDAAGINLVPAGAHATFRRTLGELKKGEWTELLIPISQLPHAREVERVQFNISESQYNHGDTLDVYLSDLSLLRYTVPTLLAFEPECAVMFADAGHLPLKVQVTGVRPGETCTITCELRRGRDVVTRLTTQATRGLHRFTMDQTGKKISPGDYDLVATVAGNPRPATAKLRLVESPWR